MCVFSVFDAGFVDLGPQMALKNFHLLAGDPLTVPDAGTVALQAAPMRTGST